VRHHNHKQEPLTEALRLRPWSAILVLEQRENDCARLAEKRFGMTKGVRTAVSGNFWFIRLPPEIERLAVTVIVTPYRIGNRFVNLIRRCICGLLHS
jgi:hypothetical protein